MEQKSKKIGVALAAVLLIAAIAAPALARDADASRAMARPIAPGASQRDALAPPQDAADWRTFRVESKGEVSFSVTYDEKSAPVTAQVVDARGRALKSAQGSNGSLRLRLTLSPGIYYLEVRGGPTAYAVTMR